MSRFGWAYVNDIITGSGGAPGGPDKAIQFASGSTFSGSTNFTFDYTSNTVRLTGTLFADNLVVSSSTIFKSGSTKFGDSAGDTHEFTGSVYLNNNLNVSSAVNITGNLAALGQLSSALGIVTNNNISAVGNITSTGGIVSASSGINTNGTIYAASNITSNGIISASSDINSNNKIYAANSIITSGTITATSNITTSGSLSASANAYVSGNLYVNGIANVGSINSTGIVSGSGFTGDGLNITGVQATNVDGAGDDWSVQHKSGDTGRITGSSNLTFSGSTLTLTGSLLMTGSSTFVNIGPTILSGNLNVSGALTGNNAFISGGLSVGNYVQMLPVGTVAIPTNQTASYIYTSGSTNDLYFTQYLPGTEYTNTTRLRWIESSLATGHQHGGILSTVTGTTTFSLTAGSGLIVEQNASLVEDSYPTVTQVNWPAYVSQSLDFISSSQITYISVNASGTIQQSTTAPTITQYRDRIVLGRILHQTGSVTNGALVAPSVTYGSTNNLLDFTRAFGPLKISGHVLAASGSTLSLTKTAGDSYAEGRNYTTNPESPNIIVSSDDPALTVSKIYRQYLNVSGNVVTDTGVGGAGFTVIDPTQYNTGGALAAVGNGEWTNQRVYWFPKSVNRALFVYYGQEKYPTFSDALEAISVETFTEGSNTAGAAIFIGIITVRGNASSLTATDARITPSGLHRGAGFGGGGGQTSAAGSTGYVQYNDAGVLGAESTFTYNSTTDTLSVPNIVASSSLTVTGNVAITGNLAASSGISTSGSLSASANATIGGNILGSGAFKAGYLTYTGSFAVPTSAYFVGMSTTGSVLTASLGSATTYPAGQTLIFKDIGGNAGTNNIRITPSGSQTIDNATSLVISNTSGSAIIISNGVDGFYIVGLT
jgi:hypothetical protein